MDAVALFRSMEGDEDNVYHTLFGDHREGNGVFTNPRSTLRMHIEKVEATWSELLF